MGSFARVADVLLGEDASALPARPRMLLPTEVWGMLAPEVVEALSAARALVEALFGNAAPANVVLESFDAMYWNFRYLQGYEAWQVDGPLIQRCHPPLGPGVAQRFAWARAVTDAQLASGTVFRQQFRQKLVDVLGSDGVLVMPTMPDVAPRISDDEAGLENYRNSTIRMLCISVLSGFPQLSMPLASRLGAPLGLSLLGPPGSERSLVRMAEQLGR